MALLVAGMALLVGVGTLAGAVLAPVLLTVFGFGGAGIIGGSIAAIIQSLGLAGYWFAILQSIGATIGAAATIGAEIGFAVSALLSAILGLFNCP